MERFYLICPKFGDNRSIKSEKFSVINNSDNNTTANSSSGDKIKTDNFEDETQDSRPEPR